MYMPYIQGFGIGAGLIIAIGAQNAFVLSQGVRRQYHWLVACICFCCDALLIFAGVAGIGGAVAVHPVVLQGAAWGGAGFLFWYGARALRAAMADQTLRAGSSVVLSLREIVLATLAVTLLNPHVYLDTVLLLGSISGQFESDERSIFALGACSASFIWFFALSLGGSLLAPVFAKPGAWRVLDVFVCCSMWGVAVHLLPI
ncbi:MAG: LysE/ArgO family amino acid transporter [Desulfoprunum sp.]|nr:LysE/ArgO family amino acid transporter [Desulfoprunum sp.]